MGVSWRGVATGVLVLIAAQVLLASRGPEAGAAGLQWLATGVGRLIDPKVAGIPNRAGWKGATGDPNWNVDPKTGVPNQDPTKPLLRDPQGRVY